MHGKVFSIVRAMLIKTTVRDHSLYSSEWLKLNRLTIASVSKNVKQLLLSYIAREDVK